jgi:predicted double-glycine peptidase
MRALVLLAVLTAWGCAPYAPPQAVKSLLEMRHENVVVQQWDLSCGAAALATLLNFQHGDPVSEREIATSMLRKTDPVKVKVRGGFSLLDLKRFVETRGLVGSGYMNMNLEQLTALGPSIVPVNLGDYNHFVVFRGLVGNKVLLADPAFGNRSVGVDDFMKGWLQNIGFAVTRQNDNPPPNRLSVLEADRVFPSDFVTSQAIR